MAIFSERGSKKRGNAVSNRALYPVEPGDLLGESTPRGVLLVGKARGDLLAGAYVHLL